MGEVKRRRVDKPDAEAVAWEVVGAMAAHPKAQQVLDILSKLASKHHGPTSNVMVVVLEGLSQQPIIRARTRGLSAFMALVSEMQALGLTDRLEEQDGPEEGLDAAFT